MRGSLHRCFGLGVAAVLLALSGAASAHRVVHHHGVATPHLRSAYVLVVDQDTGKVLYAKNPETVSSIASITKLMTAMVTLDKHLPLDETLQFTRDDRTSEGWGRSPLRPGVRITRGQALHLALMSSENHAANLLGRTYPGGLHAFVAAMNAKARALGMTHSGFADSIGLNPGNRASPEDLVRMVKAAYQYGLIRRYSVSSGYDFRIGRRMFHFHSTDRLVYNHRWHLDLQKTGYISVAGHCLVLSTDIHGRRVLMVLLDSAGKYSRFADAQRVRNWLETRHYARTRAPAGRRQPSA